jgi:hypothetical protein
MSFSRTASVTALYMAPVSKYIKPNFSATAFAVLLFPVAAGPSMAIIITFNSQKAEKVTFIIL